MVNKTVAMTICEIEKSTNEFKKTHKIKVSGPYSDEQIPKWFQEYKEQTDARFKQMDEQVPKWFKEYKEQTDARFEQIDARFKQMDEQMPKWFAKWIEIDYKPFKELVIDKFQEHGWIKK